MLEGKFWQNHITIVVNPISFGKTNGVYDNVVCIVLKPWMVVFAHRVSVPWLVKIWSNIALDIKCPKIDCLLYLLEQLCIAINGVITLGTNIGF